MSTRTIRQETLFAKAGHAPSARSVLYACSYVPQEIMTAAGLKPTRIEANALVKSNDSYFPTNFCPYVKNIASELLQEKYRGKALILATSCDGMRRLYDIIEQYVPGIRLFMLDVPRTVSNHSIGFYADNLEKMAAFLEGLQEARSVTLERLRQAVLWTGRKTQLMEKIKHHYLAPQGTLSLQDYFQVFRASMTLDPLDFIRAAQAYLEALGEPQAFRDKKKKHVMVMGNYINDEKLWDILSGLDVSIRVDDICFSHRNIVKDIPDAKAEDKKGLMRCIAESYLQKPACFRMADLDKKVCQTMAAIDEHQIDALVYISLKFCDTTLYFYPTIKEELKARGIPSLFLEIEHNKISVGQVKTRIEAFLEMI